MLTYRWREGARYQADAEAVGKAIEDLGARLGKPFGGVSASDVVDAARDADSPLHPLFTWDDAEAAEKHRQAQAGAIVRSLRVVRVGVVDDTPRRFMVAVKPDPETFDDADEAEAEAEADGRTYIALSKVARVDSLRRQAIDDATAGLNGWRRRVAEIEGAEAAVELIEGAMTALQKIRPRKRAASPIVEPALA